MFLKKCESKYSCLFLFQNKYFIEDIYVSIYLYNNNNLYIFHEYYIKHIWPHIHTFWLISFLTPSAQDLIKDAWVNSAAPVGFSNFGDPLNLICNFCEVDILNLFRPCTLVIINILYFQIRIKFKTKYILSKCVFIYSYFYSKA